MGNRSKEQIEKEFDNADRLYHYTSVDTLKKIIESKSLLFNRNDKVNDLVEGHRTKEFQSNYYTSCFTYSDKESIPLWHMYGNKSEGVRFSVKNRDFFTSKLYYLCSDEKVYFSRERLGTERAKPVYGDIIKLANGYVRVGGVRRVNVNYSDEKLLAEPTTIENVESYEIRTTNIFEMAGVKSSAWSFEEEARFFTTITKNELNIEFLFFEVDDSFFKDMSITLNPFISNKEKENIIKELKYDLQGYNINFVNSDLLGKIR